MDKGAHFHRCDFQVHTPRDLRWAGPDATTDQERKHYARSLVDACRIKGINALSITDHHCMTFAPYVRQAALEETQADGSPLPEVDRLIVFPGMELTLGVPCQALLIFDAEFPDDMFQLVTTALAITQNPTDQSKVRETVRLDSIQSLKTLAEKLDEHAFLRGRYIILPNVTDEGKHSLLRKGQAGKYIEMPSVGGYCDGSYDKLSTGTKNILAGKDKNWGNRKVACVQTSDARRADHTTLGEPSTWVKWAVPTAEAIRQACLAEESRIALDSPQVPKTYIASISVSNSTFLGPLDLAMNPQYSSFIGGRGTGKSTVLEYVRWALCDQPPIGDEDQTPNYQARRARLINNTLQPLGATVQVTYVLNGVPHVVRRASENGAVSMKIGSREFQPCTEEEVRALLPIQAYSQKQLSDVSVRVDELTRFITSPIKGELDRRSRVIADQSNRIRETYATRQRFRQIRDALNNRVFEERSITEQANAIRGSLGGLTDRDRATLDQEKQFGAAHGAVEAWQASAATIRGKAAELLGLVHSHRTTLHPTPNEPEALKLELGAAREEVLRLLDDALDSLERIERAAAAIEIADQDTVANPWVKWDRAYFAFQAQYAEALQRSSAHADKLQQLRVLELRARELSQETTRARELLATLSAADENYQTARDEWLATQAERDQLVDNECLRLTDRSGGLIRVNVRRFAEYGKFIAALKQALAGSRIRADKFDAIGQAIASDDDPKTTWMAILDELETLANSETGNSTDPPVSMPALLAAGLNSGDLNRIAETLKPDEWLNVALAPIESVPIYEFRARENEYIPFENASSGQQATALLKTLLNQPGPPLLIDQPEEDLDNPVMLEIVEQIWQAKKLRQVVFASHNANLVVNGDAELVAWFDYRTAGDQSRGTIKGEGAIDVDDTREAIKRIMEGGEAAFRLRREKYGF